MMKCGMLSWSFRSESFCSAPIPARRRNEVFAGLFQKAAGSQGRALSRAPQSAKLPFDFRFCENQLK